MSVENDSLRGQELENDTDNVGRCSLGRVVVNWIMKCDWRLEFFINVFKKKNILC